MKSLQHYRIIAWTCAIAALSTLLPATARAQPPMLGEIRFVGFNFAPQGWASCDGQLLSVAQNPELAALLGTKFGGNGTTTFALPDLRGRSPVGAGQGVGLSARAVGQSGGTQGHTLTLDEMPSHSHVVSDHSHAIDPLAVDIKASSGAATAATASGNVLATATNLGGGQKVTNIYNGGPADVSLASSATTVAGTTSSVGGTTAASGSGSPYPIVPPYLTLKCIIAIQGVSPVPILP